MTQEGAWDRRLAGSDHLDRQLGAAIDQYDRTQPEMVVRYLLSAPATLTVTP